MTAFSAIPTLAEYLDRKDRGEEFEQFVAETLRLKDSGLTSGQQATLRLTKIFSIALVEGVRGEQAAGRDVVEIADLVPRVMGYCLMSAIYGNVGEDAPFAQIAEIVKEQLAQGVERATASLSSPSPEAR